MGKGTKKKTVWRTFSFENGHAETKINGSSTANDFIDGQENNPAITNGTSASYKLASKWRNNHQRFQPGDATSETANRITRDADNQKDNENSVKSHHLKNGEGSGGVANGHHHHYHQNNHTTTSDPHRMYNRTNRTSFYPKRTPFSDKYSMRNAISTDTEPELSKSSTKNECENQLNPHHNQNHAYHHLHHSNHSQQSFRVNRSSAFLTNRYANGDKRPDHRHNGYAASKSNYSNGNYHANGILSNHNRGFRKPILTHSDHHLNGSNSNGSSTADGNNQNHIHCSENGFVQNACDDSDKCQEKASSDSNQLYQEQMQQQQQQQQNMAQHQLNSFNEDEYTRISTPRSEVLFKKGYLMRTKKYIGPINSTATTSSNDSGSVSVVSNEETASYYSIQSMSPENSSYVHTNGTSCSDAATSATYPNDAFDSDLSLMYSSGFYDNNGYFYVNPYVQNSFDQLNGPAILMPYENSPPPPLLPQNDAIYSADAKSVDEDQAGYTKEHSINNEEVSTSSLSENNSINNDPENPSPLTPPPSPFSPNETPTALNANETVNDTVAGNIVNNSDNETSEPNATEMETNQQESNEIENNDVIEPDAVIPENYSVPYFSPIIFVPPPIPFVPDGRVPVTRRNKFPRRYSNNYGRLKRNNRFPNFCNKFYVPTNWSDAPDEAAINNGNENGTISNEGELTDEAKSNNESVAPTMEQCDIILKNSKLNSNVSEFIPQSKRMIFVPLPIPPSPPAPVYFLPIASTESKLNVNVPEFLPKSYKPAIDHAHLNGISDDRKAFDTNCNEIKSAGSDVPQQLNDEPQTNGHIVANGPINPNDPPVSDEKPMENGTKAAQIADENVNEVPLNSDLLKNDSDNVNLKGDSLIHNDNKEENSHTNLKADLANKNLTNNTATSTKKAYNIGNTNNKYPKTKAKVIQNVPAKPRDVQSIRRNDISGDPVECDDKVVTVPQSPSAPPKSVAKGDAESTTTTPIVGLSYAQMVVPIKQKPNKPVENANQLKPNVSTQNNEKAGNAAKKKVVGAASANPNRKGIAKKKVHAERNVGERKIKPVEHSDGWFTVDAKGKKHVISSDERSNMADLSQFMVAGECSDELLLEIQQIERFEELQQLNEVKLATKNAEPITKIDPTENTETAQSISTEQQTSNSLKTSQKKKSTAATSNGAAKTKKKALKDKSNKATTSSSKNKVRQLVFDITEPSFDVEIEKAIDAPLLDSDVGQKESLEELEIDDSTSLENIDETLLENLIFDPNVFATPCNLQMDPVQRGSAGKLNNSLRLSASKNATRNLINQFDIYQPEYTSIENQQLKHEEEMVIKILQQLNKPNVNVDKGIAMHASDTKLTGDITKDEIRVTKGDEGEKSMNDNNVERFAINAKPNQNVYSSNHFLEHFFGDRDDKISEKIDCVDISTDLSSNEQQTQSNVENEVHEINAENCPISESFKATEENQTETESQNESDKLTIEPTESGLESDDVSQESHQLPKTFAVEALSESEVETVDSANENETTKDETNEENLQIPETVEIIEENQKKIESRNESISAAIQPAEIEFVCGKNAKNDEIPEVAEMVLEHLVERLHESGVDSDSSATDLIDDENISRNVNEQDHQIPENDEANKAIHSEALIESGIESDHSASDLIENETVDDGVTGNILEIPVCTNVIENHIATLTEQNVESHDSAFGNEIAIDTNIETESNHIHEDTLSLLKDLQQLIKPKPLKSQVANENSDECQLSTTTYNESNAKHSNGNEISNESAIDSMDIEQKQQESEEIRLPEVESVQEVPADEQNMKAGEAKLVELQTIQTKNEQSKKTADMESNSVVTPAELERPASEIFDSQSLNRATMQSPAGINNVACPWLRIVDTQMLQQQKKAQQSLYPITAAVSQWLNQAQKEKTPEAVLRLPTNDRKPVDVRRNPKYKKSSSLTSNSNIDTDSADDTASIASIASDKTDTREMLKLKMPSAGQTTYKEHLMMDLIDVMSAKSNDDDYGDDEEEDIMNFWELEGSPSLLTPQSPTPPAYNSVYGNSINYANLLSNKNEFLCNNIVNYDGATETNIKPLNNAQHSPATDDASQQGTNAKTENFPKPPEVCCIVM